jgi:hypothetical protein
MLFQRCLGHDTSAGVSVAESRPIAERTVRARLPRLHAFSLASSSSGDRKAEGLRAQASACCAA